MNNPATLATSAAKRGFLVLSRDGLQLRPANVPEHLTVGQAIHELAGYAGYDVQPAATQAIRFSLWAAPHREDGGSPDYTVLRDGQRFGEIAEMSILRVAPQPRPASA